MNKELKNKIINPKLEELDFEKIVEEAPIARDLNELVDSIREYCNSYESKLKDIREAQEVAEIMHSIVY